MKIAVISNKAKDPDSRYTDLVCKEIIANGGSVCLKLAMEKNMKINLNSIRKADMLFSMGGDGTFLNIARQTSELDIPILGINIGSLGFLAGVEVGNIKCSVQVILKGEYTLSKRMMVNAKIYRKNKKVQEICALNDIVISRGLLSRIVNLKTYIDGEYVDDFPGDGIIVATPTGSTGYSLSAGGPVVDHQLELMIVTPICPHILHAKSFVAAPQSDIKIIVDESEDYSCLLTADGQAGYELAGKDTIIISKYNKTIKMVDMGESGLYDTLRKKIYYRNGDQL